MPGQVKLAINWWDVENKTYSVRVLLQQRKRYWVRVRVRVRYKKKHWVWVWMRNTEGVEFGDIMTLMYQKVVRI